MKLVKRGNQKCFSLNIMMIKIYFDEIVGGYEKGTQCLGV
jgi:hypothetical protein